MTRWTIILCEGAHDQAALVSLVQVCGGWQPLEHVPESLPQDLVSTILEPKKDRWGGLQFQRQPAYLSKKNRYLVIHGLGSDEKVLGAAAVDFLEQLRPEAVGVVVDADEKGVESRQQAFRNRYVNLYAHANAVLPGRVAPGTPRLGLWVAPDNERNGRMDDLLLKAAARNRTKLVGRGKRFISSLAKIEHGDDWLQQRTKATLGAICQVVRPGASLGVSLEKCKCWFDADLSGRPPFRQLLAFIEALACPR